MFRKPARDDTPLLSRRFITTTPNSSQRFCNPRFVLLTLRGMLVEFLGMTCLMFISALCMRDFGQGGGGSILLVAVGNGFSYGVLVAATQQLSGGYLNPAVSLGLVIGGVLHPISFVCYLTSQLVGAIAGSGIVRLYSKEAINDAVHNLHRLPKDDDIEVDTVFLAIFYEAITSALLMMVILHTSIDKISANKPAAPIIIAFSVTTGILATYEFTGGSINPARSLGPAVVGTKGDRWDYHYIYWAGPLIGATLMSILYRLLFSSSALIPAYRQLNAEVKNEPTDTSIN